MNFFVQIPKKMNSNKKYSSNPKSIFEGLKCDQEKFVFLLNLTEPIYLKHTLMQLVMYNRTKSITK